MRRNYWIYSVACFLVWGILLSLAAAKAKEGTFHNTPCVFAGLEPLLGVGEDRQVGVLATKAVAAIERVAGEIDRCAPGVPTGIRGDAGPLCRAARVA
jgi:hypothetical protein